MQWQTQMKLMIMSVNTEATLRGGGRTYPLCQKSFVQQQLLEDLVWGEVIPLQDEKRSQESRWHMLFDECKHGRVYLVVDRE